MRGVSSTTRFRRDLRRLEKRGVDFARLDAVVLEIRRHGRPPARCRPHALVGNWAGYMECHEAPDWLPIYQVDDAEMRLFRTGSHTDLFR